MESVDVLVIGGGPAGSTCAALLARAGLSVLVLEQEVFPRYHIGESIIPSCVPVLRLSGALDKVDTHGFQDKRGGVFRWASDEWIINWSRMVHPDARSWQVDRGRFDEILLRNAEDQGARIIEGATAGKPVFDGDRPVTLEYSFRGCIDVIRTVRFRFLVDASGRAGILSARHFRDRRPHTIFQNIAMWGYWAGGQQLPGGPEGAINVISAPDGWFWNIPLAGGRASIGYVTHKNVFREQRSSHSSLASYYTARLAESESMRWITGSAQLVSGIRAEQDYSYVARSFHGPGYIIIGDAACFLDPLLATGVHLATYSALVGSAAIVSALGGELPEEQARLFFDLAYRRAYSRLIVLVARLYQRYDGKDRYFWQAQRLTGDPAETRDTGEAFMRITAGLTDLEEAGDITTRADTAVLLREAEDAQDVAATRRSHGMPGLDMAPMWDTWHHASGPATALNGLYLNTVPRLGLHRSACTAS